MTTFKIARVGDSAPVVLACDELSRYLHLIDKSVITEHRLYRSVQDASEDVILIGECIGVSSSEDDTIRIDIQEGRGIITGSNERSVLFAVYRFLYEIGCRFYRYGDSYSDSRETEYIPIKNLVPDSISIHIKETASYRHRSICIEGSVSYEHVQSIINWLPKMGLNGYYVQFSTPHTFFNGWSMHSDNPYIEGQELTVDDVKAIYASLRHEIKKRGLSLHAVGHGWTCEPLGLDGSGWYETNEDIPDNMKHMLAMLDGERKLYQNVPLNTNLCYSDPSVRELMTDAIVDYCEKNPDVDYLHFWLADSKNAQCECDNCRKMRPADYYVMMLNMLDEKLTARGISTKIVFLIYYDLLWKSIENKINNPDRFVLMFAPITRTYTTSFTDTDMDKVPEPPEYKRNDFVLSRSVEDNLAFLKDWQRDFHGDSFDFDYHLMWDHVRDIGYINSANILHRDMCNLDRIGLNGMVSCQVQRAAYPTNLPMYAMAKALWDKKSVFDDISEEYFKAEYGELADVIGSYMRKISDLVCLPYFRREREAEDIELHKQYESAYSYMCDFYNEYIEPHINDAVSFKYLMLHSYISRYILKALAARTIGDYDAVAENLDLLTDYVYKHECEIHRILDVDNFVRVIRSSMRK